MPTKKPRIQSILEQNIYDKFKFLCKKDMRTESQLANYIISQYITDYEAAHGTIQIASTDNTDETKA